MNQYKIPIMQTHLDFHTSPDITVMGRLELEVRENPM